MTVATNNYQVMIVDDDSNLLDMMEIILERAGYHVLQADSGSKALELAPKQKPDLIIMDAMMPDLNGIDCVRQLRAMTATRNVPIIMLSALGKTEDKIRGLEAGVDDYVAKPVSPKELMLRVKSLIARANLTKTVVARVIAITGAKGGVGTTTVAVNTAIALAQQEKSTVLVDMHPHSGSLEYHFKLPSDDTTHRLLKLDPTDIKRQEIDHCIVSHKSGLKMLVTSTEYHQDVLTPQYVEVLLDVLSANADYIILDLPALPNPAVRRALELSDQIILVVEPETLSIKYAQRQVERFKEWNVYSRTDVVVVNRVRTRISTFSQIEIEIWLGMRLEEEDQGSYRWEQQTGDNKQAFRQGIISTIPSSPEMLHEAIRGQTPYILVEPGAHTAHALMDIADWIIKKFG